MALGAILGGAAIGALGSYLGGREARKGAQAGARTQWRMYEDSMERNEPFRQIGLAALQDYEKQIRDPNFIQDNAQLGINALDSSAAARGLYGSTGHQSDIAEYVANTVRGSQLNRLAALAGLGQTATNSANNMSMNTAGNLANLQQNVGNARASTYLGMGNAAGGALNQYAMQQGMQRPSPFPYGANVSIAGNNGWMTPSGSFYPDGYGG